MVSFHLFEIKIWKLKGDWKVTAVLGDWVHWDRFHGWHGLILTTASGSFKHKKPDVDVLIRTTCIEQLMVKLIHTFVLLWLAWVFPREARTDVKYRSQYTYRCKLENTIWVVGWPGLQDLRTACIIGDVLLVLYFLWLGTCTYSVAKVGPMFVLNIHMYRVGREIMTCKAACLLLVSKIHILCQKGTVRFRSRRDV